MLDKPKTATYISFTLILCFLATWLIIPIVSYSSSANLLSTDKLEDALAMYKNPLSSFTAIINDADIRSAWFVLMLFTIIISVSIIVIFKNLNFGEQKGINYLKEDGTQGTARWMSLQEAEKILGVGTEKGIPFGTIKKGIQNKMVTLPPESFLNKNVAIFGASGSMKSRSFVRPAIMQLTEMITEMGGIGQSMVITDPKGEIFESMSPFLRKCGYTVRVLNLVNMINSDRWNPLTEVTDDISAQSFSETIMANTKAPGASSNEFWDKTEMNLLKALVLYVIKENRPEDKNLATVCSMLALNDAATIDGIFKKLPKDHPAKMPYNVYCQASDNVRTGVVIGLATKLQVFQNKLVQDLTSQSDIDLTLPKKEKCAYFCITSDMESTFDFIAGLFFSFLFIKLTKYADYYPKNGQKDVYFILDEFPNIGAIPDFTKKISTMRSRGIASCVIFQNIAQLKNRYPNDAWAEIIGNCDSRLFLGATDTVTAEFVSKLLGVATVRNISVKKNAGLSGVLDFGALNIGNAKRNLLNPDEILKLPHDTAILILKGQQPLRLTKMDYTKHRLAKKLTDMKVSDYKVEWAEQYYTDLDKEKEFEDISTENDENEEEENENLELSPEVFEVKEDKSIMCDISNNETIEKENSESKESKVILEEKNLNIENTTHNEDEESQIEPQVIHQKKTRKTKKQNPTLDGQISILKEDHPFW